MWNYNYSLTGGRLRLTPTGKIKRINYLKGSKIMNEKTLSEIRACIESANTSNLLSSEMIAWLHSQEDRTMHATEIQFAMACAQDSIAHSLVAIAEALAVQND